MPKKNKNPVGTELSDQIFVNITKERIQEIFDERYGSDRWKRQFEKNPYKEDDIKLYIRAMLEVQECDEYLDDLRSRRGTRGTLQGQTDGKNECINPIQNLRLKKFSALRNLQRSMKSTLEAPIGSNDKMARLQAMKSLSD